MQQTQFRQPRGHRLHVLLAAVVLLGLGVLPAHAAQTPATGHAEVTQVIYDPKKITYAKLLEWFWKLHDPTQKNGQGNDIGTRYRSVIFFHSEEQQKAATASMAEAQKKFSKPIVTEVTKAGTFYPAEVYHQEYYRLNKNKNPYCPAVITPKMEKLGLE